MPAMLHCFLVFGIVTCLSPPGNNRRKAPIVRYEGLSSKGVQAIATDAAGQMDSTSDALTEEQAAAGEDDDNVTETEDDENVAETVASQTPFHGDPPLKDRYIARGKFPYTQANRYQHSPTLVTVYITGKSGRQLHRGKGNVLSMKKTWRALAKWNLRDDGDCKYGDGNCVAIQSAKNPKMDDINLYLHYDASHGGDGAGPVQRGLHLNEQPGTWRIKQAPGGKVRFINDQGYHLADDDGPSMKAEEECTDAKCDFKVNLIGCAWGHDPQLRPSKARLVVCLNRLDRPNKHVRVTKNGFSYVDSDGQECDEETFTMKQAAPGGKPTSASNFIKSDEDGKAVEVVALGGALNEVDYNASVEEVENSAEIDTLLQGRKKGFKDFLLKYLEDDLVTVSDPADEYLEANDNNEILLNAEEDMRNLRKWEVRLLGLTFCKGCLSPDHVPQLEA